MIGGFKGLLSSVLEYTNMLETRTIETRTRDTDYLNTRTLEYTNRLLNIVQNLIILQAHLYLIFNSSEQVLN